MEDEAVPVVGGAAAVAGPGLLAEGAVQAVLARVQVGAVDVFVQTGQLAELPRVEGTLNCLTALTYFISRHFCILQPIIITTNFYWFIFDVIIPVNVFHFIA